MSASIASIGVSSNNNNTVNNSNSNDIQIAQQQQEVISALRTELAEVKDECFELAAVQATAQAEADHRIASIQKTASKDVCRLQEQLRRVQQESNLTKSQNTQLEQKLKRLSTEQQEMQPRQQRHLSTFPREVGNLHNIMAGGSPQDQIKSTAATN